MRTITFVMHMLGTETPATRLPEGTFLLHVIGLQLIALEAIWKLRFAFSTLLA